MDDEGHDGTEGCHDEAGNWVEEQVLEGSDDDSALNRSGGTLMKPSM
jgi:hypothetical protein